MTVFNTLLYYTILYSTILYNNVLLFSILSGYSPSITFMADAELDVWHAAPGARTNRSHLAIRQDFEKTSLLRRLQEQTLPDEAPPMGKIYPFSKIAVTFEPVMRL